MKRNEDKNIFQKKKKALIGIAIDASSSMESIKNTVIDGCNEHIATLQKQDVDEVGDAVLFMTQFSSSPWERDVSTNNKIFADITCARYH